MTRQKHLKDRIRARMQKTGESYTVARRHILAKATPLTTTGPERFHLPGNVPGKPMGSLAGEDCVVVHLAGISFSRNSMVCDPTLDKILKLADSILTGGFVTDTELSFSTSLRRTWSSRAWKAFRCGARWQMGLHLSTHPMCATTSPQHS